MAGTFQSLSDEIAAAVEKVAASTVRVDARSHVAGTGIVWSAEGEILTADHVLQRDDGINVTLPDGRQVPASVAGRDPSTDLALLKVDAQGLTVPEWGESAGLKVGHLVLAVGRPNPENVSATIGVVSAKGGPARGRRRQVEAYIQTDVVMYPGFSGGPLVDAQGRIVGLNSSGLTRGASLSLPAEVLRSVVESLKKHGRVKRGYLGVATQPVPIQGSIAQKAGQEWGLLLVNVEPGGPAEKGGLLQGDTLIGIDGQPVRDLDDLQAGLGPESVGKPLKLKVIRGGQVMEVTVTVGERE